MSIFMNIQQGKKFLSDTVLIYLSKNEYGRYRIPIQNQRPIMLIGQPGVGKTEIVMQVGNELGLPVVSYSMSHHTRQSAIGLPELVKKTYGDKTFTVSEYTMSEIVAKIYEVMETTGKEEGILFLDEINCVSETLAPAMLQFLQYKEFGGHKIPDGWVIVTAGNPPEYNKSVKQYDVVTWDRLKRIDVTADYEVWRTYAIESGVHASVTSFLDIKKDNFYKIENPGGGDKVFVTARGWVDLSTILYMYEEKNLEVSPELIAQYIQYPKIAKEFFSYYELFKKYKSDYQVDTIIDGTYSSDILTKAQAAKWDERLSLLGLIVDKSSEKIKDVYLKKQAFDGVKSSEASKTGYSREAIVGLNSICMGIVQQLASGDECEVLFNDAITSIEKRIKVASETKNMSMEDINIYDSIRCSLEKIQASIRKENPDIIKTMEIIKNEIKSRNEAIEKEAEVACGYISNALKFCQEAFEPKDGVQIIMTEYTLIRAVVMTIAAYSKYCPDFFKYLNLLKLTNVKAEIDQMIRNERGGDEE